MAAISGIYLKRIYQGITYEDFVPSLEILILFRNFWKSMKLC